jgi:hypothetical protein
MSGWCRNRCSLCSNGRPTIRSGDAWHKIGNLEATKKAAELLATRGVIEIWPETGLYRLKPKNTTNGD